MKEIIDIPEEMHKALEQGSFGAKYNMYDLVGCILNGTPLPDGCEILTKEAYSDLCLRASKAGGEDKCKGCDGYINPDYSRCKKCEEESEK